MQSFTKTWHESESFRQTIVAAIACTLIVLCFFIPFVVGSGTFFNLDGSFIAQQIKPQLGSSNFLVSYVIWGLNQIMPIEYVQLFVLALILQLILISTFSLLPYRNIVVRGMTALFLVFNPFTYSRFFSGQYLVLAGYGLMIVVLLVLRKKQTVRQSFTLIALSILTAIVSVHFFLITVTMMASYFGLMWLIKKRIPVRSAWPLLLAWLAGGYYSYSQLLQPVLFNTLAAFSQSDLYAFISLPDGRFGLFANLLAGFGFWNEGENQFISLKSFVGWWPTIVISMMLIAIKGWLTWWSKSTRFGQKLWLSLLIVWSSVGLFLAAGVMVPIFRELVVWLYANFTVLNILREPHKAVGVWVACQAILVGYELDTWFQNVWMMKSIKQYANILDKVVHFVFGREVIQFNQISPNWIVYFCVYMLLGSYALGSVISSNVQIRLNQLPVGWYETQAYLDNDSEKYSVLVFPWHMYMPMRFAQGRNIYNLTGNFLRKQHTLIAENYETSALDTHTDDLDLLHVSGLVGLQLNHKNLFGESANFVGSWGDALSPIGVKYILLLKEADYISYDFLLSDPDLQLVFETADSQLFLNKKFTGQ